MNLVHSLLIKEFVFTLNYHFLLLFWQFDTKEQS